MYYHVYSIVHNVSYNVNCIQNSITVWEVGERAPEWNHGWWEGCAELVEPDISSCLLSSPQNIALKHFYSSSSSRNFSTLELIAD